MKGPTSFGRFLTAAVALSSTASAWSNWLPDIDSLIVRRDDAGSTVQQTGTATTGTTPKETGTTTKGMNTVTSVNLNTGGITQTAKETGTNTKNKTTAATHTTYNVVDAAGGVTMISPPASSGTQLYKIGEKITWVWNYTSLQGTPSAIDVLASCSTASETWTLTQNMTFEPTATFVWDTSAEETNIEEPLLTQMYTLIIYDAESSVSATAEAGYLAVYNQYTFGLYTPQPYSNLSEWKCATCSAANGDLDRKALGFAVSMAAITVLSFTWFVAGFGTLG